MKNEFENEDLEFENLEESLDASLDASFDNDFDPEFDGLEEDYDEFDDFYEDEFEDVHTRTALLAKNNMFALLCVKTANQGGAICRVDPREKQPSVQIYDDPAAAIEWFTKSLRTSRKNGWQVVYDGLPLQG